jgi:hypothetical protein
LHFKTETRDANGPFKVKVLAWIEQIAEGIKFVNHVSEKNTITIPGSASGVITVGSIENYINSPFSLSPYSSFGPTLVEDSLKWKPEISAPGGNIEVPAIELNKDSSIHSRPDLQGILSIQSGTSLAAAHVTGAIALALSRRAKMMVAHSKKAQISVSELRSMLHNCSQNGDKDNWHRGMGFGVLNVRHLLELV